MYIARARVNMLDKDDEFFVSDEVLGVYLVDINDNTEGVYDEVVTKKKLIYYRYYGENIDSEANVLKQFGTINWEIIDMVKAEDLLTEEEIKKYMSISPKEMELYIENMRAKAKEMAAKYYRECHEIVDIGPKLK